MTTLRNSTSLIAATLIAGLTLTGVAIGQPARGEGKNARQKGGAAGQAAGEAAPRARRQQGGPGFEAQMGGREQGAELIRFWDNDRVAERLELTDDQVNALQQSFDSAKAALDALKDDGKEAHEALRTELEKDNPDLNAVLAADAEITKVNSERRKIALTHRVAVQSILTSDQETKLKEGRREMMGRQREGRGGPDGGMWEGRQGRGGRPGPGGPPMPPPMDDEGGAPLPPLPEEGV